MRRLPLHRDHHVNRKLGAIAVAMLVGLIHRAALSAEQLQPDHPTFGHIVVILEENTGLDYLRGNKKDAPYLNSLMDQYGLATEFYANTHPSIGNYMMLVTGRVLTNDDRE